MVRQAHHERSCNSVQYGFPTADISNVNFGRVLSGATQYAPTLQIGLQYTF